METIFSKIIRGEIPAYKVAEDEHFLAFLDISPLAKGHTLVIPKNPVDYIFDMEGEDFNGIWTFAKEVAKKIKKAIPCKKVGLAVVGLEVPHAHIHLVPIDEVSDINFSNERLSLSDEEYREIQEKIKNI